MKKLLFVFALTSLSVLAARSQVLLSGGLTYSQNFDSLSNTPAASSGTWTDNATPGLTGWYASRAYVSGTTSAYGPFAYTTYRVGDGSANNGSVWSFGTIGATDRALGTLNSGTPKTNVFGVRIQNDTINPVNNVTVSYTGEQWRNGGNTATQTLAFSYQVKATPFTSPIDVNSAPNAGWTGFAALNFLSPITGAIATPLDGNAAANQQVFPPTVLTGVTLNPGNEIFLRWLDIDDSGNDHGFGVDDFSVSFSIASSIPTYPTNISYSFSNTTVRLSWPATHLGWTCQSNAVNVADTNFWYDILGSSGMTNLNITLKPPPSLVYFRLRYAVP